MAKYVDEGVPTSEHLKIRSTKVKTDIESIPQDHVLLRLLWLSVDPYLRGKMSNQQEGLYVSAFALNEVWLDSIVVLVWLIHVPYTYIC